MSSAGGKLVYQSTKKRASGPKCPVTGKRIQGVCIAHLSIYYFNLLKDFNQGEVFDFRYFANLKSWDLNIQKLFLLKMLSDSMHIYARSFAGHERCMNLYLSETGQWL